ncbi:MAG: metal-sulfur cluster assembly factor [Candidatus Sericytochromatia bacterium]
MGLLDFLRSKDEKISEENIVTNKIKQIVKVLKNVIDPETGIDIIELGLVYALSIKNDSIVNIDITMTTSSCPLIGLITDLTNEKIQELDWVKSVELKLVWSPVWGTDMLSQEAKKELGWNN